MVRDSSGRACDSAGEAEGVLAVGERGGVAKIRNISGRREIGTGTAMYPSWEDAGAPTPTAEALELPAGEYIGLQIPAGGSAIVALPV